MLCGVAKVGLLHAKIHTEQDKITICYLELRQKCTKLNN